MTNRLTGGAGNPACLTTITSRGMGEGWSDMVALAFKSTPDMKRDTSIAIGEYITGGRESGIRKYPFTTDLNVNPLKYTDSESFSESVHKMGEVWASILYECYWNLVDAHGFGKLREPEKKTGNTIFVSGLFYSVDFG